MNSPPTSAAVPSANACLRASSVAGSRWAISSITSPETSRLRGSPPANSARNAAPNVLVGHQRQVQQPGLDGVEILAGLVQPVEGRLEMPARGRRIAPQGLVGRRQRGRLQRRLVQVAHVPQLARQQFDLEVAEAQGQEIGRQIGIDRRPIRAEPFQGGGHHLVAVSAGSARRTPRPPRPAASQSSGSDGTQQSGTITR